LNKFNLHVWRKSGRLVKLSQILLNPDCKIEPRNVTGVCTACVSQTGMKVSI